MEEERRDRKKKGRKRERGWSGESRFIIKKIDFVCKSAAMNVE